MASNKCVIVLTPNGRRQNIKVTPNTTILQILEEVCKKHDFNPEEYDLKHYNHVLDVSSIMRFTGLPNNAQLEMCPIQKMRTESPIGLGLQLENGTRLMGNFNSDETVWTILNQLCPAEIKIEDNPVVIYMRQEIYGLDAFQTTTLKSLGLTSGRAMFRLIHRSPEELHKQANVSAPILPKPVEEKPYIRKKPKIDVEPLEMTIETQDSLVPKNEFKPEKKNFLTDFIRSEKSKASVPKSGISSLKNEEPMEVDSVPGKSDIPIAVKPEKIVVSPEVPNEDFAFLGDRNALAFSLDMSETVPHEDLPDEFFELTIQDARKLLRDLKQKRMEIEERPLQTSALQNLEEDKKKLRQLSQYKKSIIRIQFPDRTVLQGTFKPTETIGVVMDFVKEYLEDKSSAFHLYTTPPKNILNPNTSLLDADCVPSAVVHFSYNSTDQNTYLQKNLFTKFISHSLASLAAARARGNETKRFTSVDTIEETMDINLPSTSMGVQNFYFDSGASTSRAGTSYSQPARSVDTNEKVPKWFKPK